MKKIKTILCSILTSILLIGSFSLPIIAEEKQPIMYEGYRPVETDKTHPYFIDQYGNVTDVAPTEGTYVEVVYDSRWDQPITRSANTTVYQYININSITLKGSPTGHYASSWYNSRMDVGMTVYFSTTSTNITRVSAPDVLSFYCPLLSTSYYSNVRATSYASGGRAYATGYVTYTYPVVETLSGTGSFGY